LFLLAVLMTGWQQSSARQAAKQVAAAEYTRWLAQPNKFAHSAAHYGMWAFKTPAPLAVADPGISAYVGSAVWMEAHLQNELLYRPAQDAGTSERFGALSPTVVITAFAPLLMLLLGFGAVAREREQGLWAISQLQARSLTPVLFAKAGALTGLTLLALLPGCIAIVYWMDSAPNTWPDTWARLLFWLLSVVIYLSITSMWVVMLSTLMRSAARALGVGLAVWVIAMVVLPRLTHALAATAAPLPTQQQFFQTLKTDLATPDEASKQQLEKMQRSNESQSTNLVGTRLQLGENHGNLIFDAHWTAVFDGIERQRQLSQWMGIVSPAITFKSLSQILTGSDFTQHRAFVSQAEEHRRYMQRTLNAEIERHPDVNGQRHLSGTELWSSVEPFKFRLPPLQSLTQWQVPGWILCAWLALTALLMVVLARREQRSPA
jgi:ABC-2 type transport system permease protein